ncbi:MAG: Amino-acid acetyltransferase, mitochondrial [Caeruleum heppii]|nr:MAG: Amino-acid acetyltransferase, mitochondrial [Caeruleum heppii]
MRRQSLGLGRGRKRAGHESYGWSQPIGSRHARHVSNIGPRPSPDHLEQPVLAEDDPRPQHFPASSRREDKTVTKDLLLSVLSSTSTKREARSYLSRFGSSKGSSRPTKSIEKDDTTRVSPQSIDGALGGPGCGVNLGRLYSLTKAAQQSPVFSQRPLTHSDATEVKFTHHVALVKIRAPQTLRDDVLDGIGRTLSQLNTLGLNSVVVIDNHDPTREEKPPLDVLTLRKSAEVQADRVVASIDRQDGARGRRLDNVLEVQSAGEKIKPTVSLHGEVKVMFRDQLLYSFRRGIVPVILPIAYTIESQIAAPVPPNEVILALTREFAGISVSSRPDEDPEQLDERISKLQKQVSVDRLIILDPLGGIPSPDRPAGAHVFINLDQEYSDIRDELLRGSTRGGVVTISKSGPDVEVHLRNLDLLQRTLTLLPPSSSAILTTPEEVANSSQLGHESFDVSRVGTRRQKNPLIHNLLTDKPAFSSSLPAGRMGQPPLSRPLNLTTRSPPATTFVKRGMPLTILPDPRVSPWKPPSPDEPRLTLHDPRIDLPRLIHLIENSFSRKLDVAHYLSRINDRLAGLIIAGEYEGGALLTWETPPGADPSDPSRLVPYLDKFAVLQRAQGAGGVADIVFKAMVRSCVPDGVCWRSRRENPVNRWYFERARGTWKMPGGTWTMFWTTEGLVRDGEGEGRFADYQGVCAGVVPSWGDGKGAD